MESLNRYLDAAILKPEMTQAEVATAIKDCLNVNPATVCIRPCDIALAKELCADSEVGVCVVLGFPHGDQLSASKADEAKRYVAAGVDEIDMVANFGLVRSGAWDAVEADIAAVSAVTRPAGIPLKVIFESCHLSEAEVTRLTETCIKAGADYVKTSTGFNGPGASDEAVTAMVRAANKQIKIKPSGGIRDAARARALIAMGVHRLGVGYSSAIDICRGTDEPAPPTNAHTY